MKIAVNADIVAAFVQDRAEVPLLAGCALWQYQRQLARFEQVRRHLSEDATTAIRASNFDGFVAFLGERPVAVQRQILSHPAFAIWLQVAEALCLREAHIRFPGYHVAAHLEDFGRFAVAAALLDRESRFAATLRRGENGALVFSGAGLWIRGSARDAHRTIGVFVEGGVLKGEGPADIQSIPTGFGGIEIEGFDWSLRITGQPAFSFMPLDDAAVVKWQASLEASEAMLGAAWAAMRDEIVQGVRCVLPVAPSGPDVHASATFQEAPGLTALSWTSDVDVLAEALVHEHHHQKLNALLATVPLLNEEYRARYYSPWRNDPRPLLGLLHGAYSFQSVVKFWTRMFEAGVPVLQMRRAVQRTHMTYLQVREALDSLGRSDSLTPLGQTFVSAMGEAMDAVEPKLPPIRPDALQRVGRAMVEHRSTWDIKNAVAATPASMAAAPGPTAAESAMLHRLGLTWPQAARSLCAGDVSEDAIIAAITSVPGDRPTSDLPRETVESSALLSLVEAHLAYAANRFDDARQAYRRFGDLSPGGTAYAAICVAFCLRHMSRWSDAGQVLGPAPSLGNGVR